MAPNLNDKRKQDDIKKSGSVKEDSKKDKLSPDINKQKDSGFNSRHESSSSKTKKGVSGEKMEWEDEREDDNIEGDIDGEVRDRKSGSQSSHRGGL